MITTVTMNPSVDKRYYLNSYQPNSVNRVTTCINSAGGKGLNVSRIARLLGEKVVATGILGGFNGKFIAAELKQLGIENEFVQTKTESRVCINIIHTSDHTQTEFLEPGEAVTEDVLSEFYDRYFHIIIHSDVIAISGSTPPGVREDYYKDLIACANRLGKKTLLDCSGKQLQNAIHSAPYLIKPNEDEIHTLLGELETDNLCLAAAKLHALGIPVVVISLGKKGAIMCCEQGLYRGIVPTVPVANTVGCGDSMIAGMAVGMNRGLSSAESFRMALAVSSASAISPATGWFEQADYDRIFPHIEVTQISPEASLI